MGKKFIDPKKSVTFRVIHRSLKDPRRADQDSSEFVFEPVPPSVRNENGFDTLTDDQRELLDKFIEPDIGTAPLDPSRGIYGSENGDQDLYDDYAFESEYEPKKRAITLVQLEKDFGKISVQEDPSMNGIFFADQDEYDYMRHLKAPDPCSAAFVVSNQPKKNLNPTNFVTNDAPSYNMKCQTTMSGPEIYSENSSVVTEIRHALEDSDCIENDLSDGFFQALNSEEIPEKYLIDENTHDTNASYSKPSELHNQYTRSHKRRSIDSDFERLLEKEYREEDELYPTENSNRICTEDINQYIGSLQDRDRMSNTLPLLSKHRNDVSDTLPKLDTREKKIILAFNERVGSSSDSEFIELEDNPRCPKLDVECVLECNTNQYNYPTIIEDIPPRRTPKIKRPSIPEPSRFPDVLTSIPVVNKGMPRDKNETPEEKRARKVAQKNEKRLRKAEKKERKILFRMETLKRASVYDPLTSIHTIHI